MFLQISAKNGIYSAIIVTFLFIQLRLLSSFIVYSRTEILKSLCNTCFFEIHFVDFTVQIIFDKDHIKNISNNQPEIRPKKRVYARNRKLKQMKICIGATSCHQLHLFWKTTKLSIKSTRSRLSVNRKTCSKFQSIGLMLLI